MGCSQAYTRSVQRRRLCRVQDNQQGGNVWQVLEVCGDLNVSSFLSRQGPMINLPGLEKVQAHVDDAVEKGAKVRVACPSLDRLQSFASLALPQCACASRC